MAHEPQPVGMWQLCHNRIITFLFMARWVKSVAALSVPLWKWNLFILHGVFGQLDCCLALPRKATNTSLWRGGGLGVILGFRFLFVVFAERRRDVTARRMELDAGNEDKETLELFCGLSHLAPSFALSLSLSLHVMSSHQWSSYGNSDEALSHTFLIIVIKRLNWLFKWKWLGFILFTITAHTANMAYIFTSIRLACSVYLSFIHKSAVHATLLITQWYARLYNCLQMFIGYYLEFLVF